MAEKRDGEAQGRVDWKRNGWPDEKFEGTSAKGQAQGRVDWKRNGWSDAKFEVTSAKCDQTNDQQREKREESRESREKREHTGGEIREKKEERRENREERREKREYITNKAARDLQMRLFEQQQLIDNRVCWPLGRRDG